MTEAISPLRAINVRVADRAGDGDGFLANFEDLH